MQHQILWMNLGMIFLMASWYMLYQKKKWKKAFKMLEKQMLNHEISILKNQMSPHFILNTIHNISVLMETDPSRSQNLLIKFGDLLRYSTYEVGQKKVELTKSLSYLEKYIELQRIRFSAENAIEYSIKGHREGKYLAPMIILPFIENAFKYGTFKETSKPGTRIFVEIFDNSLYFSIINRYKQTRIPSSKSKGIGIKNTKKRLMLIYPDQHYLNIYRKNGCFHVELTLYNLQRDEEDKLYRY